jgi:hypothetical protein
MYGESLEDRLRRYRAMAEEARSRAAHASVSEQDGYAELAKAWTELAEELENLLSA